MFNGHQIAIVPSMLQVPEELKQETYERVAYETSFNKMDLVIHFIPGKNNIGAIVKHFMTGIPEHDVIVKKIEDKMINLDEVKRTLRKKNRLFRNLDSAFNSLLVSPGEYEEYLRLKPKMHNVEKRLKLIHDTEARVNLESEFARYKQLEIMYGEMQKLQQDLFKARESRDQTNEELVRLETELATYKEDERKAAVRISDDHIVAEEKKVFIGELFSNVHPGYILTHFNNEEVENMGFYKLMAFIHSSKAQQTATFMRYDYRRNPLTHEWFHVTELRDKGVYIEDPRIARVTLVKACAMGDVEKARSLIFEGVDVDSYDYSHMHAIHAAAVNDHADVVTLLKDSGAFIDCRDNNMATPLLACIRKGLVSMVRLLLDFGADREVLDNLGRGALHYAVDGGNIHCMRLFVKAETVNLVDTNWWFNSLHLSAAKFDNIEMAKMLVSGGACLYQRTKEGKTAEEIAIESNHLEVAEYLKDERLSAPSQCCYYFSDINSGFWIGDYNALNPLWLIEIQVTHVICLIIPKGKNPPRPWVESAKQSVSYSTVIMDIDNDEDTTQSSWNVFKQCIPELIEILKEIEDVPHINVLICDPTGKNLSVAVIAAYFVIRKQYRLQSILKVCTEARKGVHISSSLQRGIDEMQITIDKKKLKRYDKQVRHSSFLSLGF